MIVILSFASTAAAIGILSCSPKPNLEMGLRVLVSAYSKKRTIEPRLSGGFQAGRYDRDSREQVGDRDELDRARDIILAAAGNKDDPVSLHARGCLLLATGECDKALPQLRRACKEMPGSADFHNDLGACLYQMGNYDDALSELEEAARLSPDAIEPPFNRALCYSRMLLITLALDDFKNVMSRDQDKGWVQEIQERLLELEIPKPRKASDVVSDLRSAQEKGDSSQVAQILDSHFSLLFRHALSDLLKGYLEAAASGEIEKSLELLDKMRTIGNAFRREKHDAIVGDAVNYLEGLKRSDAIAVMALYRDYASARDRTSAYNNSGADTVLERTRRSFHELGALELEIFCAFNLSNAYFLSGRYKDSVHLLQDVLPLVEARSWPSYATWFCYQLGIDYALLGEDSLAIKYCNRALRMCQQNLEPDAKSLQAVSLPYWHLGDLDRALDCLRRSTRYYTFVEPSARELASNYLNIADIYRQRGKHKLAKEYAEEALASAEHSGLEYLAAQSSSFLAVENAVNGHRDEASRDLSRSLASLSKTNGGARLYTEPLVLTRAGDVARERGDAQSAIESYSKAEQLASKAQGDASLIIDPLRGRARAYLALGQVGNARADLKAAVRLIENRRGMITDRTNRVHYLDAMQDVFDQTIALDMNSVVRDDLEAFGMAERSKARALLDQVSAATSMTNDGELGGSKTVEQDTNRLIQARPKGLRLVQSALPSDMILIEYSTGSSGTYVFAVTNNKVQVSYSDLNANTMTQLVNEYVSKLQAKAAIDELTGISQVLYNKLIAPIEDSARSYKYICVVPDKALHFLPFAALADRQGRSLIELHTISYAPSASILIRCLEDAQRKRKDTPERIAAIGNPDFNRTNFSQLPPLSAATQEVNSIARFYDASKSTVLTDGAATKAATRKALEDCEVAHVAAHCLIEEGSPWLAGLVLAEEKRGLNAKSSSALEDDLLYLNEINNLGMSGARLVVLSACQSALGRYYRGEGIVSLVHPFIAAHVPTVVATLWSVESEPTAELMVQFHKLRKSGPEATADALRDAQLQMAREGPYQHPYYWAPFIVVGSHL